MVYKYKFRILFCYSGNRNLPRLMDLFNDKRVRSRTRASVLYQVFFARRRNNGNLRDHLQLL